jgi:membrane protein implicated in regulation of membrane protease activity
MNEPSDISSQQVRLSPDERETMAQESSIKSRGPIAAHPVTSTVIAVLIVAAVFFVLWVPLYASATPKVGDFPFFYFYLLIYMPAVSIVLWIVMLLQKRMRPPGGPDGPEAGTGPEGGAR